MSKNWRALGLRGSARECAAEFGGVGMGYPQENARAVFHMRFTREGDGDYSEESFNVTLTLKEMQALVRAYHNYESKFPNLKED
jgi:hypothetical protein